MKIVSYRCLRCFHSFDSNAGPVNCPNCGFVYVRNMEAQVSEEDREVGHMATDDVHPSDDTRNSGGN